MNAARHPHEASYAFNTKAGKTTATLKAYRKGQMLCMRVDLMTPNGPASAKVCIDPKLAAAAHKIGRQAWERWSARLRATQTALAMDGASTPDGTYEGAVGNGLMRSLVDANAIEAVTAGTALPVQYGDQSYALQPQTGWAFGDRGLRSGLAFPQGMMHGMGVTPGFAPRRQIAHELHRLERAELGGFGHRPGYVAPGMYQRPGMLRRELRAEERQYLAQLSLEQQQAYLQQLAAQEQGLVAVPQTGWAWGAGPGHAAVRRELAHEERHLERAALGYPQHGFAQPGFVQPGFAQRPGMLRHELRRELRAEERAAMQQMSQLQQQSYLQQLAMQEQQQLAPASFVPAPMTPAAALVATTTPGQMRDALPFDAHVLLVSLAAAAGHGPSRRKIHEMLSKGQLAPYA
ncbi:MAG: hypothetical protein ACHREM_12170, partial [Polyangiales bacterium]